MIEDVVPAEISRVLGAGEHVLWSGKPQRCAHWEAADSAGALVLVGVVGFFVIWQIGVMEAPTWFRLAGVAVGAVIAGLYARVFLRPRRLPSGYVLTGRRLFTVTREGIGVRPLGELPPPTVVHRAVDGVGTITFGKRKAMPNLTSEGFRPAQVPPRLVQVADVDRVLDIVTAAMRAV